MRVRGGNQLFRAIHGQAFSWTTILSLLALVVFVNPPTNSQFLYVVHKTAHPIVFGAIALLVRGLIRSKNDVGPMNRYVRALIATIFAGAATEIAQSWVGRDAAVLDVGRDAVGAVATLAAAATRDPLLAPERSIRTALSTVVVFASIAAFSPLLWCVAAYANRDLRFPTLLQYRTPLDFYFVKVWTGHVSGVEVPRQWESSPGDLGVEVNLQFWKPGVRLFETSPNWRGYDALALDVTNPNSSQIEIVVRLNAEAPNYCDVSFSVEPNSRSTLRVPLREVGSIPPCPEFNAQHVAGMAVFTTQTLPGGLLYINRIWLDRTDRATAARDRQVRGPF